MIDLAGSLERSVTSIACIIHSSQAALARRAYRIIKEELAITGHIYVRRGERLHRNSNHYLVQVEGEQQVRQLYSLLKKGNPAKAMLPVSSLPLLKRSCCRHSYLRGAFLAGGSVNDPKGSSYHLEFVADSHIHAETLQRILALRSIEAKLVQRKDRQVVYIKDRMSIADVLTMMGAMHHRLLFEDILILRDLKREVVRMSNCDTANMQRTLNSYVRQASAINWLIGSSLLHDLNQELVEVAHARLENPEATLQELAELLNLGKSAVNHRLRKICRLAAEQGWDYEADSLLEDSMQEKKASIKNEGNGFMAPCCAYTEGDLP